MGEIVGGIKEVIVISWPMVVTVLSTLILLRLFYIYLNKEKIVVYKELLYLLFFIYILFLFQVVTSGDYYSYGININFFKELTRYKIGSRLFYRNIVGNIIMFMPFGFFSSLYLKNNKIYISVLLTFIVSFVIESIQLNIGRAFDVDDLLLNCIGGLLGYFVYKLVYFIFKNVNNKILDILVSLLTILLVCGIIIIMQEGL